MTSEQAKNIFLKQIKEHGMAKILATMYGGKASIHNLITDMTILKSEVMKDESGFYYIWGYPGPDSSMFLFSDYGITWAFEMADFPDNYEKYLYSEYKV